MVNALTENKDKNQSEWLKKADFLTETLPFMKRYANKVIVVKFGGNAMGKKNMLIILLKILFYYNKLACYRLLFMEVVRK